MGMGTKIGEIGLAAALITGTAGCNKSQIKDKLFNNTAPDVKVKELSYFTAEETEKIINFGTIINDAEVTDPDGDLVSIKKITPSNSSIVIDYDAKTVTFKAPNVEKSTDFNATVEFQDSKGAVSEKKPTLIFTSVDRSDDAPTEFNDSNLTITLNVKEGDDFKFTANPTDADGIDNISYSIKDNSGNPVSVASGVVNKGIEESISGLEVGSYTIEVSATGNVGLEGSNSFKMVSKSFDVVKDLPVEITDILIASSFEKGNNLTGSFTVDKKDTDSIKEVSYKILSSDGNEKYYSKNLAITQDGKYILNYDTSELNLGDYKVEITAKDYGNTDASTDVKESGFSVEAQNIAPTLNLSLSGNGINDKGSDNYESQTDENITFNMSSDGNIVNYKVEDITNSTELYNGENSSYIFIPNSGLNGKTVQYKITITDDNGATSEKIVKIAYNIAPDVKVEKLLYFTAEETEKIINFGTIIKDAGVTDPDGDLVSIKKITPSNPYIVIDYDAKTVTFKAPNVEKSTYFNATVEFQDSKGAVSEKKPTLIFTSVDRSDDAPTEFNDSNLTITLNVKEGDDFKFTANPTDADGIDNISYSIKDNSGNPVSVASGVVNKGIEESISGLEVGSYTIEVLATGNVGGEGSNSSKMVSKSFDVVADIPVEIKDINIAGNFTQGDNISGTFVVPETTDSTISVEYEIIDTDTNTLIYSSGNLYPNEITNYTIADFDTTGLNTGNYKIKITAVNEGNTDASTDVKESLFTLEVPTPTFSLTENQNVNDGGAYHINLTTKNIDINDITFKFTGSYSDNGDGQDYAGDIKPGESKMGGIIAMDIKGNLTVDTSIKGYGDSTSMSSGDWIEIEATYKGVTKTSRITVN